jgi:hypothetical protein
MSEKSIRENLFHDKPPDYGNAKEKRDFVACAVVGRCVQAGECVLLEGRGLALPKGFS